MLNLNKDRAHFSYSQLSAMLTCPYKYFLQYIECRGWDFVPSAVSFGGAIHESIKSFHKDSQYDCVKDESVYSERFRDQFILDVDNSNVVFKDDDEFDSLLGRGEGLIAQYVDTFSKIKPLEVEMEFRLPLVNTFTGDLLDKDIVGRIDLIADNRIFEIKTGSSAMPKSAVDENLQLILYGWAYKMLSDSKPERLVLINLIKTKQPKIQVLDTDINPEKEKKLLHLMFKVNEAIEQDCFYPNPRSTFGCGGCCYALSCEYAF